MYLPHVETNRPAGCLIKGQNSHAKAYETQEHVNIQNSINGSRR